MANTDPFSKIEAAIWSHLTDFSDFRTLVPEDNRVVMSGADRSEFDDGPKFTTHPQVRVLPDNGDARYLCSSGDALTQTWLVQIRLGDERVTKDFLPTMWAIYRALSAASVAGSELLSCTWNDKTFVIDAHLADFKCNYGADDLVGGWLTAWAYRVNMQFTSADLPPS